MRRGQVETPMVMIFAVTAGVMILLVIAYFVLRQQDGATSAQELEALAQIRDSIASMQGSIGVTQNISLGGGPYTMRCDDLNDGELFIGTVEGDETSLRGLLVAAPRIISSGVLTVTTAPASNAFRIGTFVYALPIGSSITRGDDVPTMPFLTKLGNPGEIEHTFADGKTTTITVAPDPSAEQAGTITFDDGVNPPEDKFYIDSSLLASAAATGDADLYSCALDRYVQLLAFNNALQHRRLLELRQSAIDSGSTCVDIYDGEAFAEIETILGTTPTLTPLPKGRELDLQDVVDIASAMERIQNLNGRLIRGDRCATVS